MASIEHSPRYPLPLSIGFKPLPREVLRAMEKESDRLVVVNDERGLPAVITIMEPRVKKQPIDPDPFPPAA